jgi:hypothetical protein
VSGGGKTFQGDNRSQDIRATIRIGTIVVVLRSSFRPSQNLWISESLLELCDIVGAAEVNMRLSNVLLIRQEKLNSCWHASARMLYGYKKLACTHPLPNAYSKDRGLSASSFVELAKTVGLSTLPRVNMSCDWTFVDETLRHHGPIWAAGMWNGAPHIIVITGVDSNGTLYVNDPAFGTPQVRDIGWFNARIAKDVPVPMMYLP